MSVQRTDEVIPLEIRDVAEPQERSPATDRQPA